METVASDTAFTDVQLRNLAEHDCSPPGSLVECFEPDVETHRAIRNLARALLSMRADRDAIAERAMETKAKLEAENARLREALRPFAEDLAKLESRHASRGGCLCRWCVARNVLAGNQ